MSNQDDQQDVFEMSDKFIELANTLLAQKKDLPRVSAAFRYAAARFNAFEVTSGATRIEENEAVTDTINWFSDQYKEMFTGNLKEHIAQINGSCDKH